MRCALRWTLSAAMVGAWVCVLAWHSAAPGLGSQTLAVQPRLVVFEAVMPNS